VALISSALLCALQHSDCNAASTKEVKSIRAQDVTREREREREREWSVASGLRSALELCGLASPGANPQRFFCSSSQIIPAACPSGDEELDTLPPELSEAVIEDPVLGQFEVFRFESALFLATGFTG